MMKRCAMEVTSTSGKFFNPRNLATMAVSSTILFGVGIDCQQHAKWPTIHLAQVICSYMEIAIRWIAVKWSALYQPTYKCQPCYTLLHWLWQRTARLPTTRCHHLCKNYGLSVIETLHCTGQDFVASDCYG